MPIIDECSLHVFRSNHTGPSAGWEPQAFQNLLSGFLCGAGICWSWTHSHRRAGAELIHLTVAVTKTVCRDGDLDHNKEP